MSKKPPEYEIGSDNVFADTDVPNPEEAFVRAELMRRVTNIIRERRLTQARAAEILGTNQPTVSDLMRGQFPKFSLDRLIGFLNALDRDVEITVKPRQPGAERAGVVVTGD
jgi:predicted XRE-type DNA-binding protein